MILSVSRRTDIPAHYGDWFINRLKEGFLCVRNPVNPRQVSKISLSPETIECIVFWTKNPSAKFLEDLKIIDSLGYTYYFQYTITSYDKSIEENIPEKRIQIERFKKLSERLGKERLVWRYDPIFFTERFNFDYHKKWFEYIASKLENCTEKCVVSFLDYYPKIQNRLRLKGVPEVTESQILEFAPFLPEAANKYGIAVEACCEKALLRLPGIGQAHCIDSVLINKIAGKDYSFKKDSSQRPGCGCAKSIDVGAYNTCLNKCVYCYANRQENITVQYNPESPLLCSFVTVEDSVTERVMESAGICSPELF